MNKSVFIITILAIVVILGGGIFLASRPPAVVETGLDDFAKCLTEKGAVMYGAVWCPHCQNEKKKFGSSFKYATYVECPNQPQRCLDAGISGYPTWILGDGTKLEGEQGPQKLSQATGCSLP